MRSGREKNRVKPLSIGEIRQFDGVTLLYVYTQDEQLLLSPEQLDSEEWYRIRHKDLAQNKSIYAAGRVVIQGGRIMSIDDSGASLCRLKDKTSMHAVVSAFTRFGFSEATGKYQFTEDIIRKQLDVINHSKPTPTHEKVHNPTIDQMLQASQQSQKSTSYPFIAKLLSTNTIDYQLTTRVRNHLVQPYQSTLSVPLCTATTASQCVSPSGLAVAGLNNYIPGFFAFTRAAPKSMQAGQSNDNDGSGYSGYSGGNDRRGHNSHVSSDGFCGMVYSRTTSWDGVTTCERSNDGGDWKCSTTNHR